MKNVQHGNMVQYYCSVAPINQAPFLLRRSNGGSVNGSSVNNLLLVNKINTSKSTLKSNKITFVHDRKRIGLLSYIGIPYFYFLIWQSNRLYLPAWNCVNHFLLYVYFFEWCPFQPCSLQSTITKSWKVAFKYLQFISTFVHCFYI